MDASPGAASDGIKADRGPIELAECADRCLEGSTGTHAPSQEGRVPSSTCWDSRHLEVDGYDALMHLLAEVALEVVTTFHGKLD